MNEVIKKRHYVSIFLGNIIEHYDKVLYGLLAPFIAPLFFPCKSMLSSLILAYLPLGFKLRPLGALFFGYLGDRYNYRLVFHLSMVGLSLAVMSIGLLPTYESVGILSPILLHLCRGLISFFGAGESTAAPLLLISKAPVRKKELISSFYEMSSILGSLLASLIVCTLSYLEIVKLQWRTLFLLSGVLGLVSFLLRRNISVIERKSQVKMKLSLIKKEHWLPFLTILFVSGYCCVNYNISMTMLNGYLPLVSSLTHSQMFALHTTLVTLDFFLLPLFGWLAMKHSSNKTIRWSLILGSVLSIPLFGALSEPHLYTVLCIRMAFVLIGLLTAAPLQAWAIEITPEAHRFRIISLAKAIGSQLIGSPAIALSLWLAQKTEWSIAPSFVMTSSALMALILLTTFERSQMTLKIAPLNSLSKTT